MNGVDVLDKKLKFDSNRRHRLWLMHGKWETLKNCGFADP